MRYLTLLLGVLFILILFNVGESFLKRLNIKKIYALTFVALEIICLFLPAFQIAGINFTVGGFVLPAVVSIYFFKEIKNKKYFGKLLIAYLSVVLIMQIYFLANNVYGQSEMLGWAIVSGLLGVISLLVCYYPKQAFISLFWGINTAEIIFYFTRDFSDLSGLVLGSNIMLFGLILGFLVISFCYNIFYVFHRRQKAKAFAQNKVDVL